MSKYGYWEGTGIAHPGTHPVYPSRPPQSSPPRVHPSRSRCPTLGTHGPAAEVKQAVGLKSVVQLTLDGRFSRFRGITEVYNLVEIGRNNNHSFIPGNE